MKKILLMALAVFMIVSFVFAEELGTTDSGKRFLLKDDGTWEYVKQQEETQKGLKIIDWKWSNVYGHLKIEGVVKNYTNNTYEYTEIIISIKDANGNYLGNKSTYLEPSTIRPGGTSNFTTTLLNVTNNTKSLSISYKFDKM